MSEEKIYKLKCYKCKKVFESKTFHVKCDCGNGHLNYISMRDIKKSENKHDAEIIEEVVEGEKISCIQCGYEMNQQVCDEGRIWACRNCGKSIPREELFDPKKEPKQIHPEEYYIRQEEKESFSSMYEKSKINKSTESLTVEDLEKAKIVMLESKLNEFASITLQKLKMEIELLCDIPEGYYIRIYYEDKYFKLERGE